jgi:hypothetical protein
MRARLQGQVTQEIELNLLKNAIAGIGAQSDARDAGQQMKATNGTSKKARSLRRVVNLAAIGASFGLCAVSTGASATNYFNWGAESNVIMGATVSKYMGQTSRDCTAGVAHSGSCAMKLQVIGNDGGNQQMGPDGVNWTNYPFNIVGSQAMYYRWWMKIMPGFSWGSGTAKTKSSRVIGGTYPRGYTGYLMDYGFLIGECDDVGSPAGGGCLLNNGAYNNDYNLAINFNFRNQNDGQWHEYIVKIKPNTSATCTAGVNCDAQFQAWVDGVSVGQYNNFKLHNKDGNPMIEAWGGWMLYPYFQLGGTASDGGTIYIDDISTDDTYNSLIGSGSKTPLNAPGNLRLQ